MVGKSNKKKDFINLIIGVAIIIMANYVVSFLSVRLDLTSEKRFTLSNASVELIENLEDYVYVKVYLDGDLPANYKKLKDATKETLEELRVYSDQYLHFEFINPSESPDEKTRNEFYQGLADQGLQYSNIQYKDGDKYSEKIIFPCAIISYRGKDMPVQLLKSQLGTPEEQMVNNSVQQLEYELVSNIRKLVTNSKQQVAFITGHGELDELSVADITKELETYYDVARINVSGKLNALKEIDLAIIAKPDSTFTDKDKFIIDQFVMRGGKLLWFVDNVHASMDSLQKKSTSMGVPKQLNLDDMWFKYGFRINTDLVMDLQALPIPIVTGYSGNQPRQEFFPWYYFPLLMPPEKDAHPLVKNIDAIKTEFVNSIDTVGNKNVKKTVLLTSSSFTKLASTPSRISINTLRTPPDKRQYMNAFVPAAVLLEGEFVSVFKNRMPERLMQSKEIAFKENGIHTSMIVVSDGDIIKNAVNREKGMFFPLGYDKYTRRDYGNKSFVLNAVNYLLDDTGLIEARNKEFKIRILNKQKLDQERLFWQVLNILLPVMLLLAFGLIKFWLRKKKHTQQ